MEAKPSNFCIVPRNVVINLIRAHLETTNSSRFLLNFLKIWYNALKQNEKEPGAMYCMLVMLFKYRSYNQLTAKFKKRNMSQQ